MAATRRLKVVRARGAPERRTWHFDRTISIAQLVAVITLVGGIGGPILIWGRAMESRVVVLEVINVEAGKLDLKRDIETREQRTLISTRMDKIEDRLLQIQLSLSQLTNTPAVIRK